MNGSKRAAAAMSLVLVLAGGCTATTATPSPFTPPPTSAPAATPTAAPSVPATAVPSAEPTASPGTARWDEVPKPPCDLIEPRGVTLGDGRALVLGCYSDEPGVGGLLWSPDSGTWAAAPRLERPRSSFAMTSLADGRALVVGGFNEQDASYSSVYAFDPSTDTWAKAGVMDYGRTNPGVVTLADGRVLVVGGYFWQRPDFGTRGGASLAVYRPAEGGPAGPAPVDDVDVPPHGYAFASAEVYDPETGTFTPTGPMRFARTAPAMTVLADGRVLVAGSTGDDVTGLDARAFTTAELWDPATGRFTAAGTLPAFDASEYEQPGRVAVPDYPPVPGSPGSLQPLPDGGALLVARTVYWKHEGDVTRSFRYDAADDAWREVGDTYVFVGEPGGSADDVLVTEDVPWLQGVTVFATRDGTVIRAGGRGPAVRDGNWYFNESTATADAFDPATDTWEPVVPMPAPREWAVPVTLRDGSTLLLGGYAADSHSSSEVLPVRFVPGG